MRRNILYTIVVHPVFIVLLTVGLLFTSKAFFRELLGNIRLRKELTKVQKEVNDLQGNSQDLAVQLEALQRPFAIEREARVKYGLRRAGEQVLIVPDQGDQNSTSPSLGDTKVLSSAEQNWRGNVTAWWSYFVGK